MIAKLTGIVDSVGDGSAVIDVGGVGYLVACPGRTLARLVPGERAALQVETLVREDAIQLYGFADAADRHWFRLLLSVQGVGAKSALALLSVLSVDDLTLAVAAGDRRALGRAAGVGPKLAQRIVAELADKVGGLASAAMPAGGVGAVGAGGGSGRSATADAVAALVGLGFAPADALGAIAAAARDLDADPALEALIKGGLARLAPAETAR